MARLLLLLLALVGAARAELKVEAFTDAGCVAANRVNQSTIQQNACMEIGSPPLPAGMFGSGRLNCSEATADSAWAMAVHFLRPGCGGSPNLVTTGVSGVCKNFPLGPVGTVSFIVNCGPPKVDCQVSGLGDPGACTKSCGGGTRIRERVVLTPASGGGKACPSLTVTEECNTAPCPVDCQVSTFSEWSTCNAPCGGGLQDRVRTVTQPAQNGGKTCPPLKETRQCNTQTCSSDCQLSPWSAWSPCTISCGGEGQQSRTRTIVKEAVGSGAKCGLLKEFRSCGSVPCPQDCKMTPWSEWSTCSQTCGGGTHSRTRTVAQNALNGGKPCGPIKETATCNKQACPSDCKVSAWSKFSECSRSCGGGTKSRSRTVLSPATAGGKECPPLVNHVECNVHLCPVHCRLGPWSPFSKCSKTCGGGTKTRTANIVQAAENGGRPCPPQTDTESCNNEPCPVDCKAGPWGDWSECSLSCGKGQSTRTRSIITKPQFGGKACPSTHESRECNSDSCGAACAGEWSAWSPCSKSCGGGISTRTRHVVGNNTAVCPATETWKCNTQSCHRDCRMSAWSLWSTCSKSCGGGVRKRSRTVLELPSPGVKCPPTEQTEPCNKAPCKEAPTPSPSNAPCTCHKEPSCPCQATVPHCQFKPVEWSPCKPQCGTPKWVRAGIKVREQVPVTTHSSCKPHIERVECRLPSVASPHKVSPALLQLKLHPVASAVSQMAPKGQNIQFHTENCF